MAKFKEATLLKEAQYEAEAAARAEQFNIMKLALTRFEQADIMKLALTRFEQPLLLGYATYFPSASSSFGTKPVIALTISVL
jgi:hypothetical protein